MVDTAFVDGSTIIVAAWLNDVNEIVYKETATPALAKLKVGSVLPSAQDGTLHVHSGSAGAVAAHANADNLVVESGGVGGISILVPDVSSSNIYFGSPTDNVGAQLIFNHDTALMRLGTNLINGQLRFDTGNGVEAARLDANGTLFIGDTLNANMTVGLTINQGANDDQIICGKSDDVETGLTTLPVQDVEDDDYLTIGKLTPLSGGVHLQALHEDSGVANVLLIDALGGLATTTAVASSEALVTFRVAEHDGANGFAAMAANSNAFAFRSHSGASYQTRLLIKDDGTLHATNVTAGGGDLDGVALDHEDDIGLVRVHERTVHKGLGIAMSKWDEQIGVNEDDLKRLGVLSSEGHFYNMQRMNSLLGGAIWQLHTRLMETQERLALTEHRLAVLPN